MTEAEKIEVIKKWAINKEKHTRKKRDKASHVYYYMKREAVDGVFYSEYLNGPKIFQEYEWTCGLCLVQPHLLRRKFSVRESNRHGATTGMGNHLKTHQITADVHFARMNGYSKAIGGGDYTELDS